MFWSSRASGIPHRLLIVAAAALIPAVAGCEAGNNAPTLQFHYPTDGAGTVVHGIAIRNVFVLGAPVSAVLPAGQAASLFFAVVNTGLSSDRLLSIQAPGTATSVTLAGGSIGLTPSQLVLLTGPQPQAILNGLTRTLAGGSVVTLVLNFQKAGSVTLQVPVISKTDGYATFSPPPPSPTPSASTGPRRTGHKRTGHKGKRPSASASPSTSASATPTSASPTPSPLPSSTH